MRSLLLGVLLAGLLTASPAHADAGVKLSRDGQHWGSSLLAPLFDPAVRWVPGDRRSADLWVRNAGPGRADLTVSATVAGDGGLLEPGALTLRLRRAGGAWRDVSTGTSTVAAGELAAGGQAHYEVEAALASTAAAGTEREAVDLRLDVTLEGHDTTGPDSAGLLPDTGSPVTRWLLAAGAAMVACGLSLLARRRRSGRHG